MTQEDFSKYNDEGSVIKQAQERMLEILTAIDSICRKHNITYWLGFGTLLGAVRHKSFIPWDDDLDKTVLRKDYKRLRKALLAELPEQFAFQDWTTDKYAFDHYGRVKDTKSLFDYPMFRMQKHRGLHLDIFIVEEGGVLDTKKKIDFLFERVFRTLNNYGYVVYNSALKRKLVYFSALLFAPFIYAVVGIERLWAKLIKNELLIISFGTSIHSLRYKKDIFPLQEIEFEGRIFYAPKDTHTYLTNAYGDYMKLPPPEQRIGNGVNIEIY